MKVIIAILLVVSSTLAESPRPRGLARQQAPYNPRGFRPSGAAFTLPRSQPQQAYGPPAPKPSYGPPPTTDPDVGEVTTLPPFAKLGKQEQRAAPLQQVPQVVFLPQNAVIPQPQSQNLVYVTEVQKSVPLTAALPEATILAAPLTSAQIQSLPVAAVKAVYPHLTAPYVIFS